MRRLFVLILALLLVGCTTQPTNNVTVVDDTSLAQPGIVPSGYVKVANNTVRATFAEPVLITAFKINGVTQNITRLNEKTYEFTKTFTDGNYTVLVSAEDPSGNAVEYTSDFIVDTVAPTLTLDPENNEQVATTSVTITLSFSEWVELTLAKVGATNLAFTTDDNKDFTIEKNLNTGSYTLKIDAKDKAGNTVSSETTFTVNIATADTTAPPQITGLNATNTGDGGEIKLTWDASTVNDFKEYRIYKSSAAITSVFGLTPTYTITVKGTVTKYVTGLTNGANYCFAVTAVDNSNNENGDVVDDCATPSEIDVTAPSITDFSPTGTVNDDTPTIQIETSEASTCKYAINTNNSLNYEYSNLTTTMTRDTNKTIHTKTASTLANATYNVYVLCKDEDGNVMPTVEQWEFTVAYAAPPDTTAPTVTIVSPTNTTLTSSTVWFNITTDEAVSTCSYNISSDNVTLSNSSSTVWYKSASLADNIYMATFFCTDLAGNVGIDGVNFTVANDTTAPTITNGLPTGTVGSNSTTLQVSTDESATCKYDIADGGYDAMTSTFVTTGGTTHSNLLTALAEGAHTYYVRCRDTNGNTNTTSFVVPFTVDTVAPVITVAPTAGAITNESANISWSTDELSSSKVDYGTTDCSSFIGSVTIPGPTTSHVVSLTGLTNNTLYYYKVESQDVALNTVVDDNSGNCYTFTTLA